MSNRENIKKSLKKFNFDFEEYKETIMVKLDFNHKITIDFKDDKIIILDKLLGWNFLTGMLEMSLKKAIVYNFIITILFSFLCLYQNTKQSNFDIISLYLAFIVWVILFTFFYLIKFENFKQQIMNWANE